MINLLPDERKQNMRAARMNVVLLRYNLFTLAAIIIVAIVCLGFYIILKTDQSNALSTSRTNSTQEAAFGDVKKAADNYRNNLTVAKQILNNSISYTDVIVAITKLLPKGVVLDSINLKAADFGQQTTFSAHAANYTAAIQLKQNFQSSKVFTNVFFQTLTDANVGTAGIPDQQYPISVSISAKLNKAGAF